MEIGPPIAMQRLLAPHSSTGYEFARNPLSGVRWMRATIRTVRVDEKHDADPRRTAERTGAWPRKTMS